MSSKYLYSQVPRDNDSVKISSSNYGRKLRKLSCFEVGTSDDFEYVRYTKKDFSYSTNSLPLPLKNNNESHFERFEVLDHPPESIASQMTIIDFEYFAKIQIEELVSCDWTKKNKTASNINAYTRRFNHVSYWVVEEVLKQGTSRGRANVISFFIKVARHLFYNFNNLHSLFAIISALRSASLFRLSCTWSFLPKKDRQSFEKLVELFSDTDNWAKLRAHLDSLKFPCVPFIGVYLTDLVYLSMAKSNNGSSFSLEENLSANNIFRIISTYQTESDYSHLERIGPLQIKLRSIVYIDELLKFNEDYNYSTSLRLEPTPNSSNINESPQKFTWLRHLWIKGTRLIF